jgi:hypothetical protein
MCRYSVNKGKGNCKIAPMRNKISRHEDVSCAELSTLRWKVWGWGESGGVAPRIPDHGSRWS